MEKSTKSEQPKGIRVGGIITEIEKDSFTFDFRTKNKEFKEELKKSRSNVQKIENKRDNLFILPTVVTQRIHLAYLNDESARGLYKNPKEEEEYHSSFNLPYEIFTENGTPIYRQSTVIKKEELFNRLEKAAIEQEIRK